MATKTNPGEKTPRITVEEFQAWVENDANHDKARQLTPRHRNGLHSVKKWLLAPLSNNLLSSDTFVRVVNSSQHLRSHGDEAAAINKLREVHGLTRMSAVKSRATAATAAAAASTGATRDSDTTEHAVPCDHGKNDRTVSATRPLLQSKPNVYEQDAVVAIPAGEGSEDPFWLAAVSERTKSSRKKIPILWLERDARFSARGEIFWCGQYGTIETSHVVCQVRKHWKPKHIAGWTEDSAFVCSYEEVQLVRTHLAASVGKWGGASGAGKGSGKRTSKESAALHEGSASKRHKQCPSKQTKQDCNQPCPLCVAGCGKKLGHPGPHRRKPCADSTTGKGSNSTNAHRLSHAGSTISNQGTKHLANRSSGSGSNSNASVHRIRGPTSRSKRSTAGVARRIFDPSYLGPEGHQP